MRTILNLTLLLGLLSFAGAPQVAAQAPRAAGGGPSVCLTCHNTSANVVQILKTPHAVKGDPRTPFAQESCETCHGPSAAHVASRSNPPDIVYNGPSVPPTAVFKGGLISSPAMRTKQCLTCHESALRMNWRGSQHQTNDIACNDCHTIHAAKDPILVKLNQAPKCFTCHAEQRADSFKFSHHPIREGKVVCADCHNPHGSPGPKLLKEFTVNETCYNCHAEKRGPVLWEHQPVRENCLNCHTPHGSTQARLLIQRSPYLCQDCHANGGHQATPLSGSTLAGQLAANVRLMARGCVNCHSQIHGSNSPTGTFFTR